MQSCIPGYVWSPYFCKCIKIGIIWNVDSYATEVARLDDGIEETEGVDTKVPPVEAELGVALAP